jgi:hypothetical protein
MGKSQAVRFAIIFVATVAVACSSNDTVTTTPDSGMMSDATTDSPVSEGGMPDAQSGDARNDTTQPADGSSDVKTGEGSAETSTDSSMEGGAETGTDASPDTATAPGIVGLPGYTVTVFATGGTMYSHPDSLELDGTHVWVGYNMGVKSKDGTGDTAPFNSMVVEYNLDGTLAGKSFSIPGHCDGVRVNPVTHIVWATSNEDGNPIVMSYDPASGTPTTYTFTNQPGHGGGFDDMAFVNGQFIVADSNPTADDAGIFSVPALSAITVSGSSISFSPVLMGDATAHNPYSSMDSALNLSDPDSMSLDPQGNLLLVDQADSEIVLIRNIGSSLDGGAEGGGDSGLDGGDGGNAPAPVTVYPVGTQLDDTVWATKATGMLLVADETANTIYAVHATFTPGTLYTETPNDSSIPGIVGTIDLAGQPQPGPTYAPVSPIILGLKKPTGLIFVPQ